MSLILNGTTGISDVDGTAAAPALTGTDSNTGIFFPAADTIAFSEGGVEAMRIDSAGNVGIGTSSPTFDDGTGVQLSRSGTATYRATNTSNSVSLEMKATNSLVAVSSRGNYPLIFETNGTERARIDSSGFLFLGTTSQINGGVFCVKQTGSNDCINTAPTTAGTYTSARFCNSAGSTIGFISTSTTAVTYSTTSDYRLKEAIAPMTGALATVSALKPVTYKWKADGSDGQGFIAHELQAVVPDCVTGEKDAEREEQYEVTPAVKDADGNIITEAVMGTRMAPQYQGIDTSFLVATLSAAIQELHALVKTQDSTITALTTRITALEAI